MYKFEFAIGPSSGDLVSIVPRRDLKKTGAVAGINLKASRGLYFLTLTFTNLYLLCVTRLNFDGNCLKFTVFIKLHPKLEGRFYFL
jgi:hypothetical protein